MKKTVLALAALAALSVGQIAHATPVTTTFADTSVTFPGWPSSVSSDTYGVPTIESTVVTMDGFTLTNILFNAKGYDTAVKSGDLLIDANADNTWDYVVKTLNTPLNSSALATLYAINVPLASSTDYMFATASNDRLNHPIGVKDSSVGQVLGTVEYSSNSATSYSQNAPFQISYDFGNLLSNFNNTFVIGYTFTCANDVVYQQVPVPEPGTLALLGAGLLGLGVFARRRKSL